MAYTDIDDPSAYFTTTLYTGNATARSITNDAMQVILNLIGFGLKLEKMQIITDYLIVVVVQPKI